ncbi:PLP-dependent aminotransferase family protein [Sphingobium subterraneum]|uniref:GntR family transcriptional regulator/MocR family aminotransferase n=1 Tax=Sphingobium subterraneum TaxID=627688 RepID=A0A841J3D3_9SPHN|nr:PLP-dependent aminotransferase family protein [Sphingobium subterraneum]MBB6124026.1 GntR family transcriptional regulator/MocR family aminotransferase [Sphingobium subterraneum]
MRRNWKIILGSRIDKSATAPLYMQLIQAVIRDIQSGRLPPGTYLPSTRELATMLGINRKTVVLAYDDLVAQGWLATTSTRGTMVSSSMPDGEAAMEQRHPAEMRMMTHSYAVPPPPGRSLALPSGTGLKIDEGTPDGRLFPPELLARAYRAATHRLSRTNDMQYRDPRGSSGLRRAIAAMLAAERGLPVTDENICITRGSQNGIFLAALALTRPGDGVVFEQLTYEPAVAAFERLGARVHSVGVDQHGMIVDDIPAICEQHDVRAVFTTPHHQFPTTVALRPDRRVRLVELARKYGFAIIEDDYDHEFHFQSQPLLPIAAYAPSEVVYVGSLSKLLLPSLRLGYVAAPPPVVEAIAHLVSMTDGMGNSITEETALAIIENGELRRHARKAKQIYARRRTAFAQLLADTFGTAAAFSIPDGGLAFWVRFQADMDRMEKRAAARGLRLAPSRSFMTHADAPRGLRLGFASLREEEAQSAIAELALAWGE